MAQAITYSQFVLTTDSGFRGRIASVLKDEGTSPVGDDPLLEASRIVADVAAQPGIAEAYHAALIADPPRTDAGIADDVITDAVLLSAVAAVLAPPEIDNALPA